MAEVTFGKESEIEEGKVVVKRFRRKRVAVCRFEGKFYAFKDECTHDNGALDQGELCGNVIECPRHGARFDVTTGAVLAAPAITPLEVYRTTVDESGIKVDLE